MLHRIEEARGKIFSNLQSNTGAILSISSISVRDISLAHSLQKNMLNSAITRQM
jgi:hypothetical protein